MSAEDEFEVAIESQSPRRTQVLMAEIDRVIATTGKASAIDVVSEERLTAVDVWYALIGSGAAVVIANALRDVAQRHRVKIRVRRRTGDTIEIDGGGSDLHAIGDMVGFLEGHHSKASRETRKVTETRETKVTSREKKQGVEGKKV